MKPSELFTEITHQTVLYNIQAIDNIPSIMQRGLLSNEKASRIKHKSIAMQEIQERREAVLIPNGMPLHRYANRQFEDSHLLIASKR